MDFLVIDDDRIFSEATALLIESEGHYVETAADPEQALESLRGGRFDAALLDLHLGSHNGITLLGEILKLRPNMPVVMFSAEGTVKTAVRALHQGATDFLEKPFTREQFRLVLARVLRFAEMTRKIERLEAEVKEAQALPEEALFDLGSPALHSLALDLERAAKSTVPVLFLGESGTGKSVAARLLHQMDGARAKPFVTCNCRAVSRELLEVQLFGHVRGAFAGATKEGWGKVKAAEGGFLFLDEIGDLPDEIQVRVMRLLDEQDYERVGEAITRRANVRIVAATNRDIKARIASGGFREDLFHRLRAITIELPPLRDGRQNVLEFANHYLRHEGARAGKTISAFTPACTEVLLSYDWPGNLRELHHAIEYAVTNCQTEALETGDLPSQIREAKAGTAPGIGAMISIAQLEELHIRSLLGQCANLAHTARILGIDQATLYRKRKRLGIGGMGGGHTP